MRPNRLVAVVLGAALLVPVALLAPGVAAPASQDLSFSSSPAAVNNSTLNATGFGEEYSREVVVNRTFRMFNGNVTVAVHNHLAEYARLDGNGSEVGRFVVFTSPKIRALGNEFNPVANMTNRQLLDEVGARVGNFSNVSEGNTTNVTVLDSRTNVTEFAANATVDNETVPVSVYVTRIENGNDFLVLVGAHRRGVADAREEIFRLMAAVEHPVERPAE